MRQEYVALVSLLLITSMINPVTSEVWGDQDQLEIIATTTIVEDLVQNIGGELVSVTTLIGTGIDPHDFEPTPSDIGAINNSDYIFWIGAGAEETLEGLLEFWESEGKSTPLIESVNETDLIDGNDHEGEDDLHAVDPHFWMDPLLWKQAAVQVANDLSDLIPDEQNVFENNLGSYDEQLDELHKNLQSSIAKVESDDRYLVTQHDSFSYYIKRYGFTGKSLQGISTEAEAGVQEIDALAQYIVDNDIHVVFTESTSPSEDMQAVLDAVRSMGHVVAVGGQLFVGALGSTSKTNTYQKMMSYNTETVVSAILNPPTSSTEPTPFYIVGMPFLVVLISYLPRRNVK